MNPIVRNVLAVIAGFVAASIVNMAIIKGSHYVVPPPPGSDMNTTEGIRAAMPRMTPIHYLMPFLAHALGTLVGAFAAAAIAATRKMTLALVLGGIFLLGGIAAVSMIGGPLWFVACDLVLAYIPMAWLGGRLGTSMTGRTGLSPAVASH